MINVTYGRPCEKKKNNEHFSSHTCCWQRVPATNAAKFQWLAFGRSAVVPPNHWTLFLIEFETGILRAVKNSLRTHIVVQKKNNGASVTTNNLFVWRRRRRRDRLQGLIVHLLPLCT